MVIAHFNVVKTAYIADGDRPILKIFMTMRVYFFGIYNVQLDYRNWMTSMLCSNLMTMKFCYSLRVFDNNNLKMYNDE